MILKSLSNHSNLSTSHAPADHANDSVGSIALLGHQWSTTVSLAGVLAPLATCAHHVGGDVGGGVLHWRGGALQHDMMTTRSYQTTSHLGIAHCVDGDLLQDTGLAATGAQGAPSRHHSLHSTLSVAWSVTLMVSTYRDTVVVVAGAGWQTRGRHVFSEGDLVTQPHNGVVIVSVLLIVLGMADHTAHLTTQYLHPAETTLAITLALISPSAWVRSCSPSRT